MKTHLSIDLDYWSSNRCRIRPRTFFRKLATLGLSYRLYMYHQDVVPQVNTSGCSRLINMDYHSDFCDGSPSVSRINVRPCEGDWVDWINWRKNGEFVWAPPNYSRCVEGGSGRCDAFGHKNWPYLEKNEWAKVRVTKKPEDVVSWKDIVDISIVVSPGYVDFTDLIRDGIPDMLKMDVGTNPDVMFRPYFVQDTPDGNEPLYVDRATMGGPRKLVLP